ncbi:MAG: hypothetical protein ACMVY4_00960 [Minwuia sp.]|uniref:hypothetical protein n=1 Tax=Minwuia sp. TaxID=2493630 RepID=UPI003A86D7A4
MFLFADIFRMIRDITRQAGWVGPWGAALNIPQFVGAAIFFDQPAGWIVAATNLLALMVAGQIHRRNPFSRLTSIVHLPWLALCPYLSAALASAESWQAFHWWIAYTAATMTASLAMDAYNLRLYLRDRGSSFAGG